MLVVVENNYGIYSLVAYPQSITSGSGETTQETIGVIIGVGKFSETSKHLHKAGKFLLIKRRKCIIDPENASYLP